MDASFEGIGDVTIGMTAQAFLDAYPDAKYWQGEGFTAPLGTFADSLAQGDGLGHTSTCPMTSSPYADPPDRVPLEVFIIDGAVHGVTTFLLKNVGSTIGLGNGLTTSSTIDDVAAVYGHVSVFRDYEWGERWVVSDQSGQTIQFTVDQQSGIGSVSVLDADDTIQVRPRDWFPCGPVLSRTEGRI